MQYLAVAMLSLHGIAGFLKAGADIQKGTKLSLIVSEIGFSLLDVTAIVALLLAQ